MENIKELCLVYIKKYKTQASYIALFLLILVSFIAIFIFARNYDKSAIELFEKAKKTEIENKESRELIEMQMKKLEENQKLYNCYIQQIERLTKNLEVKEKFCEEKILSEEEIKKEGTKVEKEKSISQSEVVQKKEVEKPLSVYRHEWNDERNKWLSYMYEKSGYDRDMILTFLSENDNMGLNRPSNKTGYDGNRAYGICQLYYTYHKDFINSEDFKDPYKQLDYCIGVWKNAKERGIMKTTFYAYSFRNNAAKKLVFVK